MPTIKGLGKYNEFIGCMTPWHPLPALHLLILLANSLGEVHISPYLGP